MVRLIFYPLKQIKRFKTLLNGFKYIYNNKRAPGGGVMLRYKAFKRLLTAFNVYIDILLTQ